MVVKTLRVLVTAGASGIGLAIAERLAADGARVHVCDISDDALASYRQRYPDGLVTRADVSDERDVDALFDAVIERLGGLDVLVNNAGIAGPTGPIEDLSPVEWRRTVDINLNGMFYCTRRAVPLLKAAGNGAIINLSSVAGRLGFPNRTPYAATKWAVIGLTQSLARELGPSGIRVNALLPGIVEGPRIESVIAARAAVTGQDADDVRETMIGQTSLRRMVSAQDVAEMAAFLCSPAARNVSGQSISVDANVELL
ncbi:MAG: SDR family oxidoreductase [Candidatus Velthaea sp.]